MILRRMFVPMALVVAALVAATAVSAQMLWLTVEGPERAFTVQMPGTPEYKVSANVHSYSLARGPIEYVVQTVLYAPEVDLSKLQAVLDSALAGTAPALQGGKWDKVDTKQIQGAPATEALGTFRDGNAFRNLVVLKGRRLVSLGMRGPVGTTKFPDADRFFSSLKIAP